MKNALILSFMLLAILACKAEEKSDALKYADAPVGEIPGRGAPVAGSVANFDEFKKKEGCSTEEEIKKKNEEMAKKGQAAALQGAKDSDCTVK